MQQRLPNNTTKTFLKTTETFPKTYRMIFPPLTPTTAFDAVILGDGDFPLHDIPMGILKNAQYLCCCDGAGMRLVQIHGIVPDAIVGDGDSLTEDFKIRYRHLIYIVSEQEDNDLTKATRHCMARGYKRIAYLGATGKREDHTLGNISLMVRYLKDFHLETMMITNHGYFIPFEGDATFGTFPHQQVSIFNFGATQLRGNGLKWEPYPFKEWWQGTLNEATTCSVSFTNNGIACVFLTFSAKRC